MINFDQAFGIHARALLLRAERAEVIASNLANADTPNYKARDLDFSAVFAANRHGLTRTAPAHIGERNEGLYGARVQFRNPTQPSLDQNTVDAQAEHARFLQNAIQYQTSVRFLDGRIKGLLSALRGE